MLVLFLRGAGLEGGKFFSLSFFMVAQTNPVSEPQCWQMDEATFPLVESEFS